MVAEAGLGLGSGISDAAYEAVGVTIVSPSDAADDDEQLYAELYGKADVLLKVNPPVVRAGGRHELDMLRVGRAIARLKTPKPTIGPWFLRQNKDF